METTLTKDEFTKAIASLMQGLKKEKLASSVCQGYKGTGSKSAQRQIWVNFDKYNSIDVWLRDHACQVGGIIRSVDSSVIIPYDGLTPEQVFQKIADRLQKVIAFRNQKG